MEWKYVKPLSSVENINEFECLVRYSFPKDFKIYVEEKNGGRPNKKAFDTNIHKGHELKSFLSFNKEDKETVWKIFNGNKEELSDRYIPFAIDNFGNLICFNVDNDNIVFINHEDKNVEIAAENFTEFINGLYE